MDRFIKFRLPRKVPSSMKDHIIICGYNQLVETLIDELTEQDILFVVVEDIRLSDIHNRFNLNFYEADENSSKAKNGL